MWLFHSTLDKTMIRHSYLFLSPEILFINSLNIRKLRTIFLLLNLVQAPEIPITFELCAKISQFLTCPKLISKINLIDDFFFDLHAEVFKNYRYKLFFSNFFFFICSYLKSTENSKKIVEIRNIISVEEIKNCLYLNWIQKYSKSI